MLKILPILFLPELSKFLTHYSYFIPIILTYSCNFYCIDDNSVHKTHNGYYTSEQDILPVQTFLQNPHEILLLSWVSSPPSSF